MHMVDEPASLATRRTVSSAVLSSLSAISPAATIRSRMSTSGNGSATDLATSHNVLYNTCNRGASSSERRFDVARSWSAHPAYVDLAGTLQSHHEPDTSARIAALSGHRPGRSRQRVGARPMDRHRARYGRDSGRLADPVEGQGRSARAAPGTPQPVGLPP